MELLAHTCAMLAIFMQQQQDALAIWKEKKPEGLFVRNEIIAAAEYLFRRNRSRHWF